MLMSKKLKPGQPGTKRLVTQYGTRMVCVRYRYDVVQSKHFKPIKLVIEESVWQSPAPPFQGYEIVPIRIEFNEIHWRDRVKSAGGKWNPNLKLWELKYGQVRNLGLTDRIQQQEVSDNGKLMGTALPPKVSNNGKSKTSIRRK